MLRQIDDDLEPKKTYEIKEMKKVRTSFNEMTETMKFLHDFSRDFNGDDN
ncbi:hypothetical protein AALP_AAs45548U000100 [Arabis alpina]|uniref:Uncharacterized protein n=1 Tax=Arabis alpina TaxID=50452 RepID=A0A087FZ24_ARAAL|nr:hypothetical protein AALP_AAs45548U000100 [Arabis alpina]